MKTELAAFFDRVRPSVDETLAEWLPADSESPSRIHQAMRYSVFAGGKRLRPALCVAGYSLYRSDLKAILPIACAFEMIHTYSLIHDDLPAMDDDDYRRGIPSCHKQFGEAIAILAGDGLLTFAFETISRAATLLPADRLANVMTMIAKASGTRSGMIAGQVLDLEAEGKPIESIDVGAIHRSKTGALITAAVTVGAYLGSPPDGEYEMVKQYGDCIGLAFQVVDDILDETASLETIGKTAGKDRAKKKATYPALYGVERSRAIARELTTQARDAVQPLGSRAAVLTDIADYLENRRS